MKNIKTTYVLIAWLLWIAAGSYVFHKKCGSDSVDITEEVSTSSVNETVSDTQVNKVASFKDSEYNFIQPLSPDLSKRIDSYLNRLKSDPKENLIITALYGTQEKNAGIFPDLGLARANNMKQLFVQQGIESSRIAIKSKKIESDKAAEYTALEFNYADQIQYDNTLEDYTVLFEHNPVILYFKSDSDELDLSVDQRIAFGDLVNYMDLDKDIKLNIGGHTDNIGNRESNIALSKKRALFVRDILINNGLDPARIRVVAYGPDRSIASNKTSEGRARNRRVEVSVE